MADFPDSIYDPRIMTNRDGVVFDELRTKDIYAEDFNNDRDEIVAIENALGVDMENVASNPLTCNLDFAKYKAIAMACDNGASFPASPNTGQWFYRSDIKTLFIYEAAWKAIVSFGAVTLYVDGTNGSDAVGKGYSSGAGATATIQYAINLIPSINGGNVIVSIALGTYNEVVIIQGKNFTGNYYIYLIGELSLVESITASSGVQGTGITRGSVTRNSGTWTTDQRANLLIKSTSGNNNGVYRFIDINNSDTATIVGAWNGGAIVAGDTFEIYSWATIINGSGITSTVYGSINVLGNQKGVYLKFLNIMVGYASSTMADNGGVMFIEGCTCNGMIRADNYSIVYAGYDIDVNTRKVGVLVNNYYGASFIYTAFSRLRCSKFINTDQSYQVIQANYNSHIEIRGSIIDGNSQATVTGILFNQAEGRLPEAAADCYNIIRNCYTGIKAQNNGIVLGTTNTNYINNTTNENPSGASDPSYID